jgi:hypothetical protein
MLLVGRGPTAPVPAMFTRGAEPSYGRGFCNSPLSRIDVPSLPIARG